MEYIKKLGNQDFQDFKQVFQVFEAEPFYEAWSEEDYIEEYNDFMNNGEVFGIYMQDIICGLITIKAKYLKWDQLDIDVEKSVYLSDIAVRKNVRNHGLATKLMQYIIQKYGKDFDIYMRTNLENSMSEGIAVKNDFAIIKGKVQTVSFKRTRDDIPELDERKYLIRKRTN